MHKMNWTKGIGISVPWVWRNDTTPQYCYAQSPHGHWFAWQTMNPQTTTVLKTEAEARQWCETHYACAA